MNMRIEAVAVSVLVALNCWAQAPKPVKPETSAGAVAAPNTYDGTWRAVTSQSKNLMLVVKDDMVSEVEFDYTIPGGNCFPVGDGSGAMVFLPQLQNKVNVCCWSAEYAPKVKGNQVTVERTQTSGGPNAAPMFTLSGKFGIDGTLSGTIKMTAVGTLNPPNPPCQTSATATFTARRGEAPSPGKAGTAAPAGAESGKRLLQLVQKAVGGKEKLSSIRDATVLESSVAETASGPLRSKKTTRWISPSRIRIEQELAAARLIVYLDGSTGWAAVGQTVVPLQGAALELVKVGILGLPFRLWLSDSDTDRTVNAVGADLVEITDKQGGSVRLQVDTGTGLPLKLIQQAQGTGAASVEIEQVYSDWRDVGGLRVPYRTVIQAAGRKTSELTVEQLNLNSGLTPEELSQKP